MPGTHFENACGFDNNGHYSSVHDLAVLAREFTRHPALLSLTSRTEMRIRSEDRKRNIRLKNRNILIGHYRGGTGLKTGYTVRVGKCMIAYTRRGKDSVLLVLLHGNGRWWDAAGILDIAFEQVPVALTYTANKKAGAKPGLDVELIEC